jgi:hypothetical protein
MPTVMTGFTKRGTAEGLSLAMSQSQNGTVRDIAAQLAEDFI